MVLKAEDSDCGQLRALKRRKAAAEKTLARKVAFIEKLGAEIASHRCERKTRNDSVPVPPVALESMGSFDYHKFLARAFGEHNIDIPTEPLRADIDNAMSSLRPIERFVVEARMRGVTLRRVAEIVGWKYSERARQVEAAGFRSIRHPSRNRGLLIKVRAMTGSAQHA